MIWTPPQLAQYRPFVIGQAVNTFGDGLASSVVLLFWLHVMGQGPTQTAFMMGLVSVGAMAGGMFGGHLADRFGYRRVTVASFAGSGACGLLAATSWHPVLAVIAMCCASVGLRSGKVARNALIALVAGPQRVTLRAYLRNVLNVSYVVGAACSVGITWWASAAHDAQLTSLLLRSAIGADALTSLGAAAIYLRLPTTPGVATPTSEAWQPTGRPAGWRDRTYVAMAIMLGQVICGYELMLAVVSLGVINAAGGPLWLAPLTSGVFLIVGVSLQLRVSKAVIDHHTALMQISRGIIVLAVGVLLLAATTLFGDGGWPMAGYLAAAVVGSLTMGLGDVLISAGRWELEMGLAQPAAQGAYQGVCDVTQNLSVAAVPTVVAFAVAQPAIGWVVVLCGLAAARIGLPRMVRRLAERQAAN